jgi:ATP-dependent DNA helicase PIF1
VNIGNKTGTGKSHLITVLSSTLNKLAATASKPSPLIRAVPTSITAFGINSQTIYNLLKLPVQRPFKDLLPVSLTPLQ